MTLLEDRPGGRPRGLLPAVDFTLFFLFLLPLGLPMPRFVGFLAAFLSGLLACKWMIQLVKNSKLQYFAYYCFIVGVVAPSHRGLLLHVFPLPKNVAPSSWL